MLEAVEVVIHVVEVVDGMRRMVEVVEVVEGSLAVTARPWWMTVTRKLLQWKFRIFKGAVICVPPLLLDVPPHDAKGC